MSFEKKMYEVSEKWEESYFSPQDKVRVEYIQNLIPEDAKTILDVGCGNGILVNYLQNKHPDRFSRVCGTDRSKTSLTFVKTEKYEADINKLPFADNEFDIVTCLEVIEHLPQEVYFEALNEIERIAKKYIIISVPYQEILDFSKVRCIKCKTEFNPFYHMHSFNDERVKNLYKDSSKFDNIDIHKVGDSYRPYFPMTKKWIGRKLRPNIFPNNCICPMCGYNQFDKLKKTDNQKSSPKRPSNKRTGLSKYWPHYHKEKWVAGVFKNKSIV